MLSPAISPVMVGRSRELEALREAHLASMSGVPRGAVVMGEAGIGKSRLVRDFVATLDDEVVVAWGQCVAATVPLALQPIRSLLRELVARFDPDRLRAAMSTSARLLPAALTGLADDAPDAITQEQLQEAVPALLQGISTIAPLVLVVEDVHWADAASLDLLRSMLRSLRRGRLFVVVTRRSDEVGHDHPSHPFILDLERARDVTRILLQRLTLEQAAAQARAIRGSVLEPEAAARLFARSEGVPFYVEELLAAERLGALPETLRELLLGRYATLSEATQAAVRLVAAGGVRVEHRLVARVHDGDAASLERAMREAIAAHLLRVDRDAYGFRHALIHEAVSDEMLPGERRRLHARYATALETDESFGSRHAEIAHHWRAAGDEPHALPALVAAAREARADGAPLAAAELGQQALELWSRVDDPERLARCARSELLLEVGSAYDAASDARALPFLERAVDEVPESDRRGRALLLHLAMLVRDDEALEGALALGRRALELLPDDPDDEAQLVRLRVLNGVGNVELLHNEAGARARLEASVAGARALVARSGGTSIAARARSELARGLSPLGMLLVIAGEVQPGLDALAEARAHASSDIEATLFTGTRSSWLLHQLGMYRESLRIAQDGHELAVSAGMARGAGSALAMLGAWSQVALGDLEAAAAAAHSVREADPPRIATGYCAWLEAELHLLRDEADAAVAVLRPPQQVIEELRSTGKADDLLFARLDAEIALAIGDGGAAWTACEALWRWPELEPGPAFPLLALGARALARLRSAVLEPPGTTSAAAELRLRRSLDQIAVWDVADDWRALIDAELSRHDAAAWEAARVAAARGRVPLRLHVHALERLAASHLHAGDRDAAAAAVDEAAGLAHRAGMLEAERVVEALATRARLGARRIRAQDGSSLTDRERQVLGLIAQGLTNRQIGERLFISDKTASVHVSAILRKLGAATRAEAAARAGDVL